MAEKSIRERELEDNATRHYTGARYESGRDIADIAKDLRKDIKLAVKAGFLPDAKYSVRIERYSMGRSLTVVVKDAPYLTVNPKRIAWDDAGGNHVDWPEDVKTWKSAEAMETEKALAEMAKVYNFDKSDPYTDYYHSAFCFNVHHDYEKDEADRELVRSELDGHPNWIESLNGGA